MINLGHADRELATDVGNERPHHGTLVLQRMHIAQPQVELDRAHPHRHLAERTGQGSGADCAKVGDRASARRQIWCDMEAPRL